MGFLIQPLSLPLKIKSAEGTLGSLTFENPSAPLPWQSPVRFLVHRQICLCEDPSTTADPIF